jgi:hypothetical protein
MLDLAAKLALVAAAIAAVACDTRMTSAQRGSITVRLPPPRPVASTPGFSFAASKRPPVG